MSVIYINSYQFAPAPPSGYDADAQAYITAVEAADAAAGVPGGLETAVKDAINAFVVGCKADGIWDAITGSCILAGARTYQGALVPLKGPNPTNYNFGDADYNRKTGLKGDGTTKYLDTNILHNSLPLTSKHTSVYVSEIIGANAFIGWRRGAQWLLYGSSVLLPGLGIGWPQIPVSPTFVFGQINNTTYESRCNQSSKEATGTYIDTTDITWTVLERNESPFKGSHRVSFYSIGESLSSSLLDARVTTLINAFSAAIP